LHEILFSDEYSINLKEVETTRIEWSLLLI